MLAKAINVLPYNQSLQWTCLAAALRQPRNRHATELNTLYRRGYMNCCRAIFVALCLTAPTGVYAQDLESLQKERLIYPETHVGGILRASSEKDLIMIYGGQNVTRSSIPVGEGQEVEATVLFSSSTDKVFIEWKKSFSEPQRITIDQSGTKWKTKEGITVGTSLDELEKINGGPFLITGFGWDYPGRTVSWEKGKLPRQLQLELGQSKDIGETEYLQVVGDGYKSSDHPVIKKMGLKVRTIYVRW